jgi:hypothetical protein
VKPAGRLELGLLAGLAVLACAGLAGAQSSHAVNVTANDDPEPCVQDTAPCFTVSNWTLVEERDTLQVTVRNGGTQAHGLAVATGEQAAEEGNATPREAAFLEVDAVGPGATATATASVPDGTDTVHLFCPVDDHEEQGMHLTRNVYPNGSVAEGRQSGPGLGDPDDAPVPAVAGLVGLVAGALALGTLRRP